MRGSARPRSPTAGGNGLRGRAVPVRIRPRVPTPAQHDGRAASSLALGRRTGVQRCLANSARSVRYRGCPQGTVVGPTCPGSPKVEAAGSDPACWRFDSSPGYASAPSRRGPRGKGAALIQRRYEVRLLAAGLTPTWSNGQDTGLRNLGSRFDSSRGYATGCGAARPWRETGRSRGTPRKRVAPRGVRGSSPRLSATGAAS